MFGLFNKKKQIHEPLEKQHEDVLKSNLWSLIINGLDCDQVPNATGLFGSRTNPIPVNGLIGEFKYLGKLRGQSGQALMFHRLGSFSSPVVKNPIDCYEIVCLDGTQWNTLFFDLYHPRRSNLTPPGYSLMLYSELGIDMPYAYGCNVRLDNFPYDLPEAVIEMYGEHPGATFARKIRERLQKYHFQKPGS